MRLLTLQLVSGLAVTLSLGCDRSATVPDTINLTGTWTGTESDRLGLARLTWNLTQTGNTVSGTAIMRPVDATDGSCASCHKFKDGTFSGTLSGATLTLEMFFAAGGADPTPACSITISGTVTKTIEGSFAGTYGGSDPCEGTFEGTLDMTRSSNASASSYLTQLRRHIPDDAGPLPRFGHHRRSHGHVVR